MNRRVFRPSQGHRLRVSSRIVFIIATMLLTFANLWTFFPVLAACTVSGTVYQDYNASGTQDQREPGVIDITVTAYQTSVVVPPAPPPPIASLTVGTATTAADGTYTMNVPVNGEIRIEFTDIPQGLRSGRFGTGNQSTTTTTFVDCNGPQPNIDLAVNSPGEYCSLANPQLATSCYVLDDQLSGPNVDVPTFVTFPNAAAGDPTPGTDELIHLATADQIGTTWGLGYHRGSDSWLVGAFLKRHTGFGPGGPGAIYRITPGSFPDPDPAQIVANVTVGVFTTIPGVGADPHPTSTTNCLRHALPNTLDCWQYDTGAWPLVGKMSLGDVDISDDDKRLYAINLSNRTLYEVPITNTFAGITAGAPRPIPMTAANIPNLGDPDTGCPTFNDWRPFALGMHKGFVYVGAVCSAETSQDRDDLNAYVYQYDPLNPGLGFTEILAFPLDYPRRCADSAPGCSGGLRAADWQPWSDTWAVVPPFLMIRPEPWLTDISFDGDNMILAFRDRNGDRTGNMRPAPYTPPPNESSDDLALGIAAGDVLRACFDATTGTYTLEENASCGGINTAGAGNTQGPASVAVPAGGEYYWEDMNDPAANNRHDEITLGGTVDLPGVDNFAVTVFDPLPPSGADNGLFDGGVVWFNHDDGGRDQNFRIFNSNNTIPIPPGTPPVFGKSNGLGDLEAVCGPPPLEIGNRVWEDLDRNGAQDPGELPLAGVVLQLYMISDSFGRPVNRLIGQTTTSATGEYYFNESNLNPPAAVNGTPIVNEAFINFWDTNRNGTRELHESIGVMPNAIYEIRLDAATNYGAGAPLDQYYITAATTRFFNDLNDVARDSDGRNGAPAQLVSTTNFPSVRLTTGDFGDNNHTYDFGFALLPSAQPSTSVGSASGGSGGSLEVAKGVDKPFAAPGEEVIWTITVRNNGTTPATNVEIIDQLPDTLQIQESRITVSSSTGTVTVNGNTVTFRQAVLQAGEVVTITIPTIIDSDITVPFVIVNQVQNYNASAQVLSVTQLPSTGESIWGQLRTPLILLAGGIVLAAFVVMWRRRLRKAP